MGRPWVYSDAAISCALTIRSVFSLPLRQTTGFTRVFSRVMGVDLPVPDPRSLCRPAAKHQLPVISFLPRGPIDLVLDSTGLKVYGDGEWKARCYGVSKRRTWRKLHIGVTRRHARSLLAPSLLPTFTMSVSRSTWSVLLPQKSPASVQAVPMIRTAYTSFWRMQGSRR